jgi:palmitoyltransferase ZDHHC13/17
MDRSPSGGGSSGQSPAPTQPSSKSAAAAPTLNNEVELGHISGEATSAQNDIMQIARIGDIAAMEKLFGLGEYDATYTDEEGITPLHVSPPGV